MYKSKSATTANSYNKNNIYSLHMSLLFKYSSISQHICVHPHEIISNKENIVMLLTDMIGLLENIFDCESDIKLNKELENKRFYLKVPFSEKDKFRNLGAKWDSNRKQWYIETDHKNFESIVKISNS